MTTEIIDRLLAIWRDDFPGAELPLGFRFAAAPGAAEVVAAGERHRCWVADLARVRKGRGLAFGEGSFGCGGAAGYCGFSEQRPEHFAEFLSSGIPGRLEGERYKRTPQLVRDWMQHEPAFAAPERYLIAERLDRIEAGALPAVVAFFATADVLSGLFTWANFNRPEPHGVIAPMGAGCATLVQWPMAEFERPQPRAVLGLMDVSARPFVPAGVLSLAVPWPLLVTMVETVAESFLYTDEWTRIKDRMRRG
jgi:hypothetical protein